MCQNLDSYDKTYSENEINITTNFKLKFIILLFKIIVYKQLKSERKTTLESEV